MCLALWVSGLWLRYASLQNLSPSFSWIARPTPSTPAQSKERKGSNFAIWQPCFVVLLAFSSSQLTAMQIKVVVIQVVAVVGEDQRRLPPHRGHHGGRHRSLPRGGVLLRGM